MYLKTLELVGFKSFADKTRLEFKPGMTAIVGPNGCGKSNVSDAIRWVLGEQSAKALRGSKMEDCIFNGTDDRKALAMAEVAMTLTDCEGVLDTEFHEVTVSRRVFRSGEGQYFLNKAPCRLKDIQRLFMDTGIGTTSYSLMEQGRIDGVLSSRPEDRRTIFEEASGITKFKADKKEAIRKLDHTEANLLRLSDVIREVKRQIGSLQRQAGKARRYKSFKSELRGLDIYATRERLRTIDTNVRDIETKIVALNGKLNTAHRDVEAMDQQNEQRRDGLVQAERRMGQVMEEGVKVRSSLEHTQELIKLGRQRIDEYRELTVRDTVEIDESRNRLEENRTALTELTAKRETLTGERATAEKELETATANYDEHTRQIGDTRRQIQKLREESVELESTTARLRNQLLEIEQRERTSVIQRERLAAEKAHLSKATSAHDTRQAEMSTLLGKMREEVTHSQTTLSDLESRKVDQAVRIGETRRRCTDTEAKCAAREAQIELLRERDDAGEDFPGGARALLDAGSDLAIDRDKIMGTLVSHLDVDPDYATALESVLRPWLDAIVVADPEASLSVLQALVAHHGGPARLLSAAGPMPPPTEVGPGTGIRLIDYVKCDDAVAPLLWRLLGSVRVVDELPASPTDALTYVTRAGALFRGDGSAEFWMSDAQSDNPLSRRNALAQTEKSLGTLRDELTAHRAQLDQAVSEEATLGESITAARQILDQGRRTMAQKEGESQVIGNEANQARERLETVAFELNALASQGETGDTERKSFTTQLADTASQRERITATIAQQTTELQSLENRHSDLQAKLTDRRIRFSTLAQECEHVATRCQTTEARVAELDATVKGRSAGIEGYRSSIERLGEEIKQGEGQLVKLEEALQVNVEQTAKLREERESEARALQTATRELSEKREALETLRTDKSDMELRCSESKMRRQNQIDRITSDYSLTVDQIMEEAEPEWDGPVPTVETIDTRIAELRTKMDAMGPVNLVAIDEYKDLEERFSFLTVQEEDLVNSKQQLMDMIRKINKTTSELFRSTFDEINTNFQDMFKTLFDGGSAKLVLVNEEDVLDCGIEIIARPPGKKLQNVSLLSGGERTLTAVALLFSIYMCKPSPFCLLDELDAALDDSNIGRFVRVLKGFLSQSQFLIITHNQHTIEAANVLYGVTMPDKGVSKLVSMQLKDHEPVPVDQ